MANKGRDVIVIGTSAGGLECGGTLWEMQQRDVARFRCHRSLVHLRVPVAQSNGKDRRNALDLTSLFEERKNLLKSMADRTPSRGAATAERLREADVHIERIRAILRAPGMAEVVNGHEEGRKARRPRKNTRKGAQRGRAPRALQWPRRHSQGRVEDAPPASRRSVKRVISEFARSADAGFGTARSHHG